MIKFPHPFHIVSISPWPALISLSIFNNLVSITSWMNEPSPPSCCCTPLLTMPPTLMCMYLWWQDIAREATFTGSHSIPVQKSMRLGMILFIISETMLFTSFFWAYFHSSLAPSIELGQSWPPAGIIPFNPFNIPLLNTIILITSGLTITWSHHSMMNNKMTQGMLSLTLTIILGTYFTLIQLTEYMESPFTMSDSIYGSLFFISTGFHGIHVLIGTTFLLANLARLTSLHFSSHHHFSFEAATWYWHFVDIIWLFLYLSIYWWGS